MSQSSPSVRPKVSAYIPCYNNLASIEAAVRSVLDQSLPPHEVFVIDDGSTDGSIEAVERMGVPVIRMERNGGRGAVRARAMDIVSGELVLSVDATNTLAPDFLAGAVRWFEEPGVAAVYGKMIQGEARNAVERWRGRHLLRLDTPHQVARRRSLITWGVVVRRSAVLAVGNFDRVLRHSEDVELGTRLLEAGWDVVYDPTITLKTNVSNSMAQVMERYWRWYVGTEERLTPALYLSRCFYTLKVMCRKDLAHRDVTCALISLLVPQYFLWRRLRAPERNRRTA